MSTNVGGMGAHWTVRLPAARRRASGSRFLPDLDELLDEAERLLAVDRHPFDDAPFADEVRDRLAAEFDAGRRRGPPGARRCRWPCTGGTTARLVWSGPDVVFGDVTRANPNFTLFAEALVTPGAGRGRPRASASSSAT